jgi:hypothetical protein
MRILSRKAALYASDLALFRARFDPSGENRYCHRMRTRVLLLAAAMLLGTGAWAQTYKWVDRNGRVQYGDAPPPGVKATPLRGAPAPAAQPPAPAQKSADGKSADPKAAAKKSGPLSPAEQEAEYRKRQIEAQKEQEKQAAATKEASVKKDNCERAQEYLRTLDSGQRISRTDAKGERVFLEDAEIAREKSQARQNVQAWCN